MNLHDEDNTTEQEEIIRRIIDRGKEASFRGEVTLDLWLHLEAEWQNFLIDQV